MNKVIATLFGLGLAIGGATAAQAGTWDGVWGQKKGAFVQVAGTDVKFSLRGSDYRVYDVKMSPQQLTFAYGEFGGLARLTMNSDQTAEMTLQSGQGTSRAKIWRGRR